MSRPTNPIPLQNVPMTLVPLYLGGETPEKSGMKQDARITSINSSLVSNLLMIMFFPS